ncbi:hypothetical protein J2T19_001704 [Paenibacillus tundrae]|uniref:Uncharacterized protein n=1 Tax=Paenibacillus tundrae TaxID=528187 RepID=A0ABT9WAI5_9BACL|nr:hypothetical protein [Paenibacillus tundrae]
MNNVGVEVRRAGERLNEDKFAGALRLEQPSKKLSLYVKRKEDAEHECTFCCKCWTDE